MVGPEAEKTAIVRHVARMFVTGASLTVPLFGIVLRKGYGLGAQAMIGGGFHASFFTVAWPTGEFGGMGLEGYVRLGFRKEMEAIADPVERETTTRPRSPSSMPTARRSRSPRCSEIDEVIDPADTRHWIMSGPALGAEAGSAHDQEAAVHRSVVSSTLRQGGKRSDPAFRDLANREVRRAGPPPRLPGMTGDSQFQSYPSLNSHTLRRHLVAPWR
jgi:hypothetical protein